MVHGASIPPTTLTAIKEQISMTIIYLYVKTHKITGLKYLGKTTSKNPHRYTGSGKYWKLHLKKHGKYYDTEIIRGCLDDDELKQWGIYYSKLWNVTDSDEWANMKPEEGDGAQLFGDKNGMFGKHHSASTKEKQSLVRAGKSWEEIYGEEQASILKDNITKKLGGKKRPSESGQNHPKFDHTLYTFYNDRTNETIISTKFDFRVKFNMKHPKLYNLVNHGKTWKGWRVLK